MTWTDNCSETTLNVYTQVLDESVRAAAETVGNQLFSPGHTPAGATERSTRTIRKRWLSELDDLRTLRFQFLRSTSQVPQRYNPGQSPTFPI